MISYNECEKLIERNGLVKEVSACELLLGASSSLCGTDKNSWGVSGCACAPLWCAREPFRFH